MVEESSVENELKKYHELPQIPLKADSDVGAWWREHAKQFPNVSVMARQFLGCPASSAAVERLFSRVGIAFSAKRKRSDAETLQDIMFANANLP